jgi:hypothetical protein
MYRKCSDCRKLKVKETTWERIRRLFFELFKENISDLSADKFTQGFGDGYTVGFKSGKEYQVNYVELINDYPRDIHEICKNSK